MLSPISLDNRLRALSDLLDRGCEKDRWQAESREMNDLGYRDPEDMVAAWRRQNGRRPMEPMVAPGGLLFVDLTMYPAEKQGREAPTSADWFGCPCLVSPDATQVWNGRFHLGGRPLSAGDKRRVLVSFPSGEDAITAVSEAGTFYLWETRIIGEACVATF